MGCAFCDAKGVVLVDFVPRGHAVNADYYCTLLLTDYDQQSTKKRPGLLQKGVFSMTMHHHTALVGQYYSPAVAEGPRDTGVPVEMPMSVVDL